MAMDMEAAGGSAVVFLAAHEPDGPQAAAHGRHGIALILMLSAA